MCLRAFARCAAMSVAKSASLARYPGRATHNTTRPSGLPSTCGAPWAGGLERDPRIPSSSRNCDKYTDVIQGGFGCGAASGPYRARRCRLRSPHRRRLLVPGRRGTRDTSRAAVGTNVVPGADRRQLRCVDVRLAPLRPTRPDRYMSPRPPSFGRPRATVRVPEEIIDRLGRTCTTARPWSPPVARRLVSPPAGRGLVRVRPGYSSLLAEPIPRGCGRRLHSYRRRKPACVPHHRAWPPIPSGGATGQAQLTDRGAVAVWSRAMPLLGATP